MHISPVQSIGIPYLNMGKLTGGFALINLFVHEISNREMPITSPKIEQEHHFLAQVTLYSIVHLTRFLFPPFIMTAHICYFIWKNNIR